jgi:putative ABC transport system permease protein
VLTGPQVARARQVAADAGMTVEARDHHQTRLAATRSGATAAGDLRTLTATGATGGVHALLGAAGAYLALLAGYHDELDALGRAPVAHLAVTVVALLVTAAAVGWLLAGREPSTLARQPRE